MCGIAGLLTQAGTDLPIALEMAGAIAHRGPDDQGLWVDDAAGIGLGHRRLSIIELSPLGHQPMISASGRYVIVFNGEIYNHAALRAELDASGLGPIAQGAAWRGHSDTETLIEGIAAWGLEATLGKCVGMFALALWDRQERLLHLARDRFGEKPLYYGWAGGDFVFASELKSIRVHPRFDNEISRAAVGLFAARTYIPAPLSIYERLFKLTPGCILTVTPAAASSPRRHPPAEGRSEDGVTLRRYWSYRDVVRRGLADPIVDESDALAALEASLVESIRGQSVADVPVGAFLSGGIDSSTVVALYQKHSSIPVRTFSIGFDEAGYNEAGYAKAVAQHFGTVHHERYVTAAEAREVIPLLPAMYDEPFADSSQIPTYLVSCFAREQVTVALSGDGGDELFAGYARHFAAPRLWRYFRRVPRSIRAGLGHPLGRIPSGFWNIARGRRAPHFGAKVQKALRVAGSASSFDDVCRSFLDEWSVDRSPVLGVKRHAVEFDFDVITPAPDALRMMYGDAVSYLPDDILCKVDRASMAVSLEARVPFLDHRVAETAARIPLAMKIRGGGGKHILRQLLYREAPQALFERPKAGFSIPVGPWLKGPLREWAEDLLSPKRMAAEGYLDPAIVQRRWQDHLSGRRDSTPALWAVLMFQAWLRTQSERVLAAA
jgi:asparagine synthase (glutamine-hydrolysing)